MKKLASLILALVFTVSLTLAVINQATQKPIVSTQKNIINYATILPIGPPEFPKDKKKKGGDKKKSGGK